MENKKAGLFAGLPAYTPGAKKTDDYTWGAMETLVSWAINGTAPAALAVMAECAKRAWARNDWRTACRVALAALSSDYGGQLALSATQGGPWSDRR